MLKTTIKSDLKVAPIFDNYPEPVKDKLYKLRQLILDTANEIEIINTIEETLKWGEPSYLTKHGSAIRINCKKNDPELYAMYFQCTSKLVPTFKIVYQNNFTFEGNRALVFNINDTLPEIQLKKCIQAGLTYHKVKHLPLLGL